MPDIYDLLQKIQKRPAMYLGRHSIICLQAFLSGYNIARYELGSPQTDAEQEFKEFPQWIRERYKIETGQSWASIILFYSEDEAKALDRFFKLFEEFLNRDKSSKIDTNNDRQNSNQLQNFTPS